MNSSINALTTGLAVTEYPVDGIEGHRRVQLLRHHRFGRLGPVHDGAAEDTGFSPLLGKERIGATQMVGGLVDRDVLHGAIHV
jgi:hypothetical protein